MVEGQEVLADGQELQAVGNAKGAFPEEVLDYSDSRVVLLREFAQAAGVALYDVTFPQSRSGVLQVFISSAIHVETGIGSQEIGHEQCVKLARIILDSERVEELLPGAATLEVSTPGINRALRSVVQLRGAVGERVRISGREYCFEGSREKLGPAVIRGVLQEVARGHLKMIDEGKKSVVTMLLSDVKEARVDFAFDASAGQSK